MNSLPTVVYETFNWVANCNKMHVWLPSVNVQFETSGSGGGVGLGEGVGSVVVVWKVENIGYSVGKNILNN